MKALRCEMMGMRSMAATIVFLGNLWLLLKALESPVSTMV